MTDTPDTLVKVARDLREILHLEADLLTQAVNAADDHDMPGGDALVALSPVANLEAWDNLVHHAEEAGEDIDLEHEDDADVPPLQLLLFWSEDWRREHGAETDHRPTLRTEVDFLRRVLDWAYDTEVRFTDFARDVRKARRRMENLLHAGVRAETGAPCLQCNQPLTRQVDDPKPCAHCERKAKEHEPHDRGGVQDGWWFCRNPDCSVYGVTDEDYARNVGARHLEHAASLTAADIQRRFGVRPGTLRQWALRGQVRKAGKHSDGRMLYRVEDVRGMLEDAEKVTA